MTAHERSLVSQAADSVMADEGPSAEAIFNAAGIPWRSGRVRMGFEGFM